MGDWELSTKPYLAAMPAEHLTTTPGSPPGFDYVGGGENIAISGMYSYLRKKVFLLPQTPAASLAKRRGGRVMQDLLPQGPVVAANGREGRWDAPSDVDGPASDVHSPGSRQREAVR